MCPWRGTYSEREGARLPGTPAAEKARYSSAIMSAAAKEIIDAALKLDPDAREQTADALWGRAEFVGWEEHRAGRGDEFLRIVRAAIDDIAGYPTSIVHSCKVLAICLGLSMFGSPGCGGSSPSKNPAAGGTVGTDAGAGGQGGQAGHGDQAGHGGHGGQGGGSAIVEVDVEKILAPLAQALCRTAQSCCPNWDVKTPDMATCVSGFAAQLPEVEKLRNGTLAIDEPAVARCAEAYAKAPPACGRAETSVACQGLFFGKQADGESCGNGTRASFLDCDRRTGDKVCIQDPMQSPFTSPGICQSMRHGKPGETCVGDCLGAGCSSGFFGTSNPAFCFQSEGLYCPFAETGNARKCAPILAVGASCLGQPPAAACGHDNYCDPMTSQCRTLSKVGEPCDIGQCADGSWCNVTSCVPTDLFDDHLCRGTLPVLF